MDQTYFDWNYSPLSNKQAGWNKRAKGANFDTLINEQGEILEI